MPRAVTSRSTKSVLASRIVLSLMLNLVFSLSFNASITKGASSEILIAKAVISATEFGVYRLISYTKSVSCSYSYGLPSALALDQEVIFFISSGLN